jgi:hypothetical protein
MSCLIRSTYFCRLWANWSDNDAGNSLNVTLEVETFAEARCDNDIKPLDASMFGCSGTGGFYNETVVSAAFFSCPLAE